MFTSGNRKSPTKAPKNSKRLCLKSTSLPAGISPTSPRSKKPERTTLKRKKPARKRKRPRKRKKKRRRKNRRRKTKPKKTRRKRTKPRRTTRSELSFGGVSGGPTAGHPPSSDGVRV